MLINLFVFEINKYKPNNISPSTLLKQFLDFHKVGNLSNRRLLLQQKWMKFELLQFEIVTNES